MKNKINLPQVIKITLLTCLITLLTSISTIAQSHIKQVCDYDLVNDIDVNGNPITRQVQKCRWVTVIGNSNVPSSTTPTGSSSKNNRKSVQIAPKTFFLKENSNSGLLGMWKHVKYTKSPYADVLPNQPPTVNSTTLIFSRNSFLEVISQTGNTTNRGNAKWQYISKSNYTGVLEIYDGSKLVETGNIRWINRNQFEHTVVFNTINANAVGNKTIFKKQ